MYDFKHIHLGSPQISGNGLGARDDIVFPGFKFDYLELLRRVLWNHPSWDFSGLPLEGAQRSTDPPDNGVRR